MSVGDSSTKSSETSSYLRVIVLVVVIALALVGFYTYTIPSQRPSLSGVCTVYDYFEADTVAVEFTTVTTTIGNTTTYYTVTSIITPTPTLTASSTFTTEAPSNVTSNSLTTTLTAGFPSLIWNVTVCTFTR